MLNLKKILLKIRYLEEEHKDCEDLCNKAKIEIEKFVRQTHSDLNVFDKDLDKDYSKKTSEALKNNNEREISKRIDNPQWTKKLFRKIAMITHPDKVPDNLDQSVKDKFLSMYQKSKILIDEGDYVGLIIIASDLNIDISSLEIKDSKIFKEKQSDLERSISELKKSIYWIWFHSSDDKRNEIIKEFIKQSGWTSKEAMRKKSRSGSGKHPGKSIGWARSKINIVNKKSD